jgi:hypothetical protein
LVLIIVKRSNNITMRGNHQHEKALMKFTPEVAETYQVQHYTRDNRSAEKLALNDRDSSTPANNKHAKATLYNKAV